MQMHTAISYPVGSTAGSTNTPTNPQIGQLFQTHTFIIMHYALNYAFIIMHFIMHYELCIMHLIVVV